MHAPPALDDELAELASSIAAADPEGVRARLGRFHAALDHYVREGERVLFPAYERVSGSAAVTARMRDEHRRIRRLARSLDAKLAARDRAGSLAVVGALRSVVLLHVTKEDWVLRPAAYSS